MPSGLQKRRPSGVRGGDGRRRAATCPRTDCPPSRLIDDAGHIAKRPRNVARAASGS